MEAQAVGTPAITVDAPGSRDVAGGAAVLIPEFTVDDLATAMARLAADASLRRDLSERGMINARRFSCDRCAEKVLGVLEDAARS